MQQDNTLYEWSKTLMSYDHTHFKRLTSIV